MIISWVRRYTAGITAAMAALVSVLIWPTVSEAGPTVRVYTDKGTYLPGETIDVSLSARNLDAAIQVDVYVGLLTWDDSLYMLGSDGWTGSIEPWIRSIYIPFPFNMNRTSFFSFDVPCEMPPIGEKGSYLFAAGLSYPGLFLFVSDLSFAPFAIESLGLPQAFIDSISPNPAVYGENTVQFAGHGVDTDGSIVAYQWGSDLDGPLSTDEDFETPADQLTLGTHTITFKVKDNEDHWSKAVTESLTIRMPNQPPTAHIDSISPNPAFQGEDDIVFKGHGTDADGSVSLHEWTSDLDGFLGADAELVIPAADLSSGMHTISYRAQDDRGDWSEPVTENTQVVPLPGQHLYVDGTNGDDSADGSEGAPMRTVTHALASAKGSATSTLKIHVAQGTYCEETNGETFPLNVGSWVFLEGSGADLTVLDAAGQAVHVIACVEARDVVIKGFTITGGNAQGSQDDENGGGILCSDSSAIIMRNTIVGNTANELGGGISYSESSGWVIDNVIAENTSAGGGGIHCYVCSPVMRRNVFAANTATSNGGGIYCYGGRARIENNWIIGNSAESYGGGIRCNQTASPHLKNNLMTGNSAETGGAIACNQRSSPTLINCTLTGNLCRTAVGGIYCSSDSDPTIENSIVWANDGVDVSATSDSQPVVTYSDIEGGYDGEGNIDEAPAFVPGPFGACYLAPESPCVDAGSISAQDAGFSEMTTQTDGTPDVGLVDLGYHYPLP